MAIPISHSDSDVMVLVFFCYDLLLIYTWGDWMFIMEVEMFEEKVEGVMGLNWWPSQLLLAWFVTAGAKMEAAGTSGFYHFMGVIRP